MVLMTRGARDKLPQYEDDIRNNSFWYLNLRRDYLFTFQALINIFPFKPFLSSPNNIFRPTLLASAYAD